MLKEVPLIIFIAIYLTFVLILILMEHAQRGFDMVENEGLIRDGLNPYFNGTCSKRVSRQIIHI